MLPVGLISSQVGRVKSVAFELAYIPQILVQHGGGFPEPISTTVEEWESRRSAFLVWHYDIS